MVFQGMLLDKTGLKSLHNGSNIDNLVTITPSKNRLVKVSTESYTKSYSKIPVK